MTTTQRPRRARIRFRMRGLSLRVAYVILYNPHLNFIFSRAQDSGTTSPGIHTTLRKRLTLRPCSGGGCRLGGSKRPVGRSNPTVLALLQAWIPQRCSAPLSDDRQLPRARVADCAHDLQPARGEELRAHGRLVHELVLTLPHPLLRHEGSGSSARPHPLPRPLPHPLVHVARGRPARPGPLLPALLPLTTPP